MSKDTRKEPNKHDNGLFHREPGGWYGRWFAVVDGVRMRVTRKLDTHNKAVARRKLNRLVAGGDAGREAIERSETFAEVATRVHAARVADDVVTVKDEWARLDRFVLPHVGGTDITKIATSDVNEVLAAVKAAGRSKQTCQHVRQAMAAVFKAARREGVIEANPVDDAELPPFPKIVRKERAVLTDAELAAYLGWEHPQEQWRDAIRERQTMACLARMFGGLRTGDLHELRWEAFDVECGRFAWGWAPRRKTRRPQLLEVPDMLRPMLRDWWERAGRPSAGLVFPARRGKRAGESKIGVSHARAFRRDLRRAFGVEVPEFHEKGRSNGRRLTTMQWTQARPLTQRERELFEETEYTLPVDFHSWRRAYTQALADADVNAQQASALAGHASLAAHARYLANSGKPRSIPAAALPSLDVRALVGAEVDLRDPLRGVSTLPRFSIQRDLSGADGTRTRGLLRDRQAF